MSTPTTSPRVTILRGKFITAWDGSDKFTPPCPVWTLADALERVMPGDVYMCGYAPEGDQRAFRRLAKVAATAYELDPELTPVPRLEVAFVDIDCPEHGDSSEAWVREQLALVPANILDTAGWYQTPHGMRLVVLPPEPLELVVANSYLRQLHEDLARAGVGVDATSPQWTRLFRAPRANNLDLARDFSRLAPTAWRPGAPLVREDAGAYGEIVQRGAMDWPAANARPTKAELEPLRAVNKRLADDLHHGRFAVPVGGRHGALLGAAADITRAYDTADPGVAYALLAEPFRAMGKDDPAELRRLCEWACAAHAGRKAQQQSEERALSLVAARELHCSTLDVRQRLIVDAGANQWVWDESEQVYKGPLTHAHQLKAALARHCPTLAGEYAGPGIGADMVYKDCSVAVQRVVYTYEQSKAGLDLSAGVFRACDVKVCDDLVPREHKDVQQWLDALFGPVYRDRGLDWLASVPVLGEAICALYLDGPPSAGKGMLALGIARIWSKESSHTQYAALTDNFNGELTSCPLILADEKVEAKAGGQGNYNDSSVFRRIVGNVVLGINEKYHKKSSLVGAPRVLILANNIDAMRIREELSAHDLAAVRLRLGYIKVPGEDTGVSPAAQVLHDLGAAQGLTAKQYTNRWVEGGALAEHILWLSATRKVQAGHRLLVEGWDSPLTTRLSLSVGAAGNVAHAICSGVLHGYVGAALHVEDGVVYVNPEQLASDWDRVTGNTEDRCPSPAARIAACRSLAEGRQARKRVQQGGKATQVRFWAIPAERLAIVAQEAGLTTVDEFTAVCQTGLAGRAARANITPVAPQQGAEESVL